jgi:Ca2+:H+ antiporter
VLICLVLVGAVLASVHHAEVLAHRVGEPFGTLLLAVAVTVIEVALVVSLMLTGGPAAAALARDTVFAAVMIICNGAVGLTIPAVGALSIALGVPLVLGLPPKETVLLVLTLGVGVLTLGTGRTTVLHGVLHLVIFAVFLFLAVVP